ncbi:pectinesterase family protein, partial [Mesonia mobilis]|uniref:pectinesterase family protein n=1 Tax=Mesonia mobilis TaxID=369791 RepID=UPI0026EB5C3F
CELLAKDGVDKVYLGRPWRSYAKTVFINSTLGEHIVEKGWDPWTGDQMFPQKEKTTYYAEYQSKGKGASPKTRVAWSHQLTKNELRKYTIGNIFSGNQNDWKPNTK